MKKSKIAKSRAKQSVKNCNKTNTRNCKNNSSSKITGFDESKSYDLEDNYSNSSKKAK